ncbi:MAG TPA: LLM class flavin-dependent oxidoreductase [Candidatus Limnocylindrales bacterium]|nr:LLM class flavin-dependent oxidoreductase [Candidatus Limnocylindrales bacterium]
MGRITVGYQDGCLHPLWLTNAGLRIARLLGAESLWLPDHFMGFIPAIVWKPEITPAAKVVHSPDGLFDPLQILAVTATRLRGVDLGTAVTEAYRRHPMALAQSFVTLDHISKGHAILGIGNGERENVEPYGLPWGKQVARLEEALIIIRKLWASNGEPVTYEGRFWQLRDAIFNLPLYNGRQPRIWIAAHAPKMLALTGRYGDGWLPTLRATPEEYRQRLDAIHAAGRDAGRNMDHFVPCQMILTALGDSRDQMIELALKSRLGAAMALLVPGPVWKQHGKTHPLGENFGGFYDIVPPRVTEEHIEQAARDVTAEMLLSSLYAGSPSQIRDEVAPIVAAGAKHIIVSNIGGTLTGGGAKDIWLLGSLIRKLRRL